MKKPTVVLMGSKSGSVVALSILLQRGWDVKYVVTSKNATHLWIAGLSLKQLAESNNIRVVTQVELPRDEKVDFVLSYMFRYRVKTDIIAIARRAALNFHAAPLPEFGGWAFYNMAVLENASEYGCTCHHMDDSFDTGPLLKVKRFPVNASEETAYSLEQKTQKEMIRLFIDFCHMAETRTKLPLVNQDKKHMRYLRRDEFESLKEIPPGSDAETVERYARAFWYPPYDCAYVKIGQVKVEIVPKMVKSQLATLLHANDLRQLQRVAQEYKPEKNL